MRLKVEYTLGQGQNSRKPVSGQFSGSQGLLFNRIAACIPTDSGLKKFFVTGCLLLSSYLAVGIHGVAMWYGSATRTKGSDTAILL